MKLIELITEREDKSEVVRLADDTVIVYERIKGLVAIRSVVGNKKAAMEWAENLGEQVVFIGRRGWAKALNGRPGWKVEDASIGYFRPVGH